MSLHSPEHKAKYPAVQPRNTLQPFTFQSSYPPPTLQRQIVPLQLTPLSRSSDKISKQHEQRTQVEKREMQDRVEQAREEERKEVERKGEDQLDMSFQQLKKIPDVLYRSMRAQQTLGKIILLDLSHNNLLELPKSYPGMLYHLSSVRKLDLSHNKLQQIPGEIESLGSLEIFDLYGNALVELPPQIGKLRSLKVLNLGGNALTDLPTEFNGLTSLTYLSMERNRIESLSPGVLNLPALKTLNLGLNELSFLPRDMAGLKSLAFLNVTMNKVERIPNSFGKMENLQKVVLVGRGCFVWCFVVSLCLFVSVSSHRLSVSLLLSVASPPTPCTPLDPTRPHPAPPRPTPPKGRVPNQRAHSIAHLSPTTRVARSQEEPPVLAPTRDLGHGTAAHSRPVAQQDAEDPRRDWRPEVTGGALPPGQQADPYPEDDW